MSELDANEFFDVWRQFNPEGTREEFEREWAEFQEIIDAMRERLKTQ